MFYSIAVAFIIAFCKIDSRWCGMTMLDRPLLVSTLIGLLYGDVQTGLTLGAQLELLSMGLVGIGAHAGMPDIAMGSGLCTAFVIGSGAGAEMALALALPIGTFSVSCGYMVWIPLNHIVSERSLAYAKQGDYKGIERCQWLGLFNYFFFPFCLALLGMVAGAPVFEWLVEVTPTWITDGVKVASSMLPALGFALLMKLTFSWRMSMYLFVGFVAVAFIGLSNVGVAIIGVILAMFAFFANDGSTNGGSADDNEI